MTVTPAEPHPNGFARSTVVGVAGDEGGGDAELPGHRKHGAEHGGCMSAAASRGAHVIANVATDHSQLVVEPVPDAIRPRYSVSSIHQNVVHGT